MALRTWVFPLGTSTVFFVVVLTVALLQSRSTSVMTAIVLVEATGPPVVTTTTSGSQSGTTMTVPPPIQCDLYLAESTIPNAGLGIFSAIERNEGDVVGSGDVCIPIIDFNVHHPDADSPLSEYVWGGEIMGMKYDALSTDVEAICPGLDCAINCNIPLINVGKSDPVYDEAGLHRSNHPGAGSFTPYHNGTTIVTRKVPPGGELFKWYGDSWFETRHAVFGNIPFSYHFNRAQRLLTTLFSVMVGAIEGGGKNDYHNEKDVDGDSGQDDVKKVETDRYPHVMKSPLAKDLYKDIILGIRSIWDSRTLNAMPQSFADMKVALDSNDITVLYQPNATRSLDWLHHEGRCADHIYWNYSTLSGAGRGAFARRDLPKGTIITGSPLHIIPRYTFDMFPTQFVDDEVQVVDNDDDDDNDVVGRQIALNYCYGHSESSLLLLPYGVGINYINHNQSQANVKIQWSTGGSFHDDIWLTTTPTTIFTVPSKRIGLDYIATRDIMKGEELFLDYGPEWEVAWTKHMDGWTERKQKGSDDNNGDDPSHSDESDRTYMNAHEWNKMDGTALVRTDEEAYFNPYPENLQIRCHTDLVDKAQSEWKSVDMVWEWSLSDYGFSCDILYRRKNVQTDQVVYRIQLWTEPTDRWDDRDELTLTLDGVPRDAIRFFDMPCSTDIHQLGVFRQPIGLPDELVPDIWRDLRTKDVGIDDSIDADVASSTKDDTDEL